MADAAEQKPDEKGKSKGVMVKKKTVAAAPAAPAAPAAARK